MRRSPSEASQGQFFAHSCHVSSKGDAGSATHQEALVARRYSSAVIGFSSKPKAPPIAKLPSGVVPVFRTRSAMLTNLLVEVRAVKVVPTLAHFELRNSYRAPTAFPDPSAVMVMTWLVGAGSVCGGAGTIDTANPTVSASRLALMITLLIYPSTIHLCSWRVLGCDCALWNWRTKKPCFSTTPTQMSFVISLGFPEIVIKYVLPLPKS